MANKAAQKNADWLSLLDTTTKEFEYRGDKYTWVVPQPVANKIDEVIGEHEARAKAVEEEIEQMRAEFERKAAEMRANLAAETGLQALLDKAEVSTLEPPPTAKTKATRRGGKMSKEAQKRETRAWSARAREWLRKKGHEVSDRGALPRDKRELYEAATGDRYPEFN